MSMTEIEALACFRYTHWIGLDWIEILNNCSPTQALDGRTIRCRVIG